MSKIDIRYRQEIAKLHNLGMGGESGESVGVAALKGGSSRVEVRETVKDSCEVAVPSTVLWRSLPCPEGLRHVVRACVALDHHNEYQAPGLAGQSVIGDAAGQ